MKSKSFPPLIIFYTYLKHKISNLKYVVYYYWNLLSFTSFNSDSTIFEKKIPRKAAHNLRLSTFVLPVEIRDQEIRSVIITNRGFFNTLEISLQNVRLLVKIMTVKILEHFFIIYVHFDIFILCTNEEKIYIHLIFYINLQSTYKLYTYFKIFIKRY